MRSDRFRDAFNKLAAAEQQFRASEFLAPIVKPGEAAVRVAGVVNRFRISPADFIGFGVFKPTSATEASLLRQAKLAEQRAYLQLFPLVRLVLCKRTESGWLAATAHRGDGRFRIDGLVPVQLVEEAQQFDIIRARFDGGNFWFESLEASRDPATAAWLRAELHKKTPPDRLDRSGLTPEERQVYALVYLELIGPAEKAAGDSTAANEPIADTPRERLRVALQHAGADLVDYLEHRDGYRVTYQVAGQRHVSSVRKDDLTVQVAGICLSGEDQRFDLASLVGVLREADVDVPRVGPRGIREDDYWQVHPPRDR